MMQATSFNLQSTVQVLQSKWKPVLLFVAISMMITTITLLVVPKYYRSVAIIVPANSTLADKAHLFNPNIENLYSYFGSGDDLDRLYGIASMDTVYKQLVDEFNLVQYYQLRNDDIAVMRRSAVGELREDVRLQKTELGQLRITGWTKDKDLSARIVNRLVEITQMSEEAIWKARYEASMKKLNSSVAEMETEYKTLSGKTTGFLGGHTALEDSKMHNLLEQINSFQKAANEFKVAIQNNAPALYVMEKAAPAAKSEKPNRPGVLIAAFLISLVFGSLAVLVYNREPYL